MAPIEEIAHYRDFEWNHEPDVTLKIERFRASGQKLNIPKEKDLLKAPRDPVPNSLLAFEPQRIRNFNIIYFYEQNMIEKESRYQRANDTNSTNFNKTIMRPQKYDYDEAGRATWNKQ